MSTVDRFTYANVMSTIAVVGLLSGGTAYAAAMVGSGDIKQNAVQSRHVAAGEIRSSDLANRAVTRKKLGPGVQGARAYAHVTRDAGDFVVDGSRSKNVVDVTLPTTGNNDRPCVVLPAWIDATKAVVIGTVDAQNTPDSANATVQHRVDGEDSQGCEGNSVAVYLKRIGGGDSSTIAFNVMVP